MVHQNIAEDFINAMRKEIKKESFSIENGNYVQIINNHNLTRLSRLLENEHSAIGGSIDEKARVIEPTVLYPSSFQSTAMQEEIFGPILPLKTFKEDSEVLEFIQGFKRPLAIYIFSKRKKQILFVQDTH